MIHVVAIYRSEITEVEGFKKVALVKNGRLDRSFHLGNNFLCAAAKLAELTQHIPYLVFHLIVGVRSSDVCQVILQGAHIGVDGHTVVVEDNEQVGPAHSRMV